MTTGKRDGATGGPGGSKGGLCSGRCVAIIVLGDIGRSPRMRYHAESLSREGAYVHMIGYCSSSPVPDSVAKDPAMSVHAMAEPPVFLSHIPRLLALPLKLAWQAVVLSWALLWMVLRYQFKPDAILVQNPPALPTLPVAWAWATVLWADFVVDWHNYAHTLMAISATKGEANAVKRNPVVKFAKLLEEYFGKKADKHLCVTRAMKDDLKVRLNIDAVTLYDRPPDKFKPLEDSEKKGFLKRLGIELSSPELVEVAENLDSPSRTRVLLSSTSWTEDEDFSILLNALQNYEVASRDESSMYPPLLVFITGKGPLKSYYQKLIEKMDFSRVKIHLPWLADEDYPKLLGSADLGISLHYSSSGLDLPMKVVDMFGCALPVCAVDFQCLEELVMHGKNSQVFHDSTELAEQIQSWFRIQPGRKNPLHQKFREVLTEWGGIRWHENWTLHAQPLFSY